MLTAALRQSTRAQVTAGCLACFEAVLRTEVKPPFPCSLAVLLLRHCISPHFTAFPRGTAADSTVVPYVRLRPGPIASSQLVRFCHTFVAGRGRAAGRRGGGAGRGRGGGWGGRGHAVPAALARALAGATGGGCPLPLVRAARRPGRRCVHTKHSRKADPFSVARPKMDLPFSERICSRLCGLLLQTRTDPIPPTIRTALSRF